MALVQAGENQPRCPLLEVQRLRQTEMFLVAAVVAAAVGAPPHHH